MSTDRENAADRVRDFLAARAGMGGPMSHEVIARIGVAGVEYDLTTDDLRILSGWDGYPAAQPDDPPRAVGACCHDSDGTFFCTLPNGHGGEHIAHGCGRIVARWYR